MELTVTLLRTWFRAYNDRYFGGSLPEPSLQVSHTHARLGQFSCRRLRKNLFRYEYVGHTIKVSDYYDMPEREYQQTLLHEMIHYYITYTGARDTAPHGPLFRQHMARINADGWHIKVSDRRITHPVRPHYLRSQYLLMLLRTTDNRHFLSVIHPAYRKYIEKQALSSPTTAACHFLITTDHHYASWPQVRSLRASLISKPHYEELLQSAQTARKLK